MDELDTRLLDLLGSNARRSVTELAKALGVARATVQERMRRLESQGPLRGYTTRLDPAWHEQQVTAHVMIAAAPRHQAALVRALQKLPGVRALHTISGQYDLIAVIRERSTQQLDACIDAIGALEGVERTLSSIVLSTKFER